MNQYPAAFEFTDMYLTVLSDSMWIPVFSTFLFNCPQQSAEHSIVKKKKHPHACFHTHARTPNNCAGCSQLSVDCDMCE